MKNKPIIIGIVIVAIVVSVIMITQSFGGNDIATTTGNVEAPANSNSGGIAVYEESELPGAYKVDNVPILLTYGS